jgi:hypothetical protein
MTDIFLSYSNIDKEIFKAVSSGLCKAGYEVWSDTNLKIGEFYSDKIQEKLLSAKVVLVIWTEYSKSSTWVKAEAVEAIKTQRLLQITFVPAADIPFPMRAFQAGDFTAWKLDHNEICFQELLSTIKSKIAGDLSEHSQLPEGVVLEDVLSASKSSRMPQFVQHLAGISVSDETEILKSAARVQPAIYLQRPSAKAFRLRQQLLQALTELRVDDAGDIGAQLIGELRENSTAFKSKECIEVLDALQWSRLNSVIQEFSDYLITIGFRDAGVQTAYAKSLAAEKKFNAAAEMIEAALLQELSTTHSKRDNKLQAARILERALAVIYRSAYVSVQWRSTPKFVEYQLLRAIDLFASSLKDGDIFVDTEVYLNLISSVYRAEEDQLTFSVPISSQDMAQEMIHMLEPLSIAGSSFTISAGLSEAFLPMKRPDLFKRHAITACAIEDIELHELLNTIERLEDVWRVSAMGSDGKDGLLIYQETLLRRKGTQLPLPPALVGTLPPERPAHPAVPYVFTKDVRTADEAPLKVEWMRAVLERASAVVKITERNRGAVGSGFLVQGHELSAALSDEIVVVTNNHVLPSFQSGGPRAPDAEIMINIPQEGKRIFSASDIIWSSPTHELDTTVFRLRGDTMDLPYLPIAADNVVPRDVDSADEIIILGFPYGGEQVISFTNSKLVSIGFRSNHRADDIFFHYRTPTAPGSSGSPLLSKNTLFVVGIHHAGGRIPKLNGEPGADTSVNEGISIKSIIRSMNRQFK